MSERFKIYDFDQHDEHGRRTILCVVDEWQVGADGERLIIGEYKTPELAEAVRDAFIRVFGNELPASDDWPDLDDPTRGGTRPIASIVGEPISEDDLHNLRPE